MTNSTLPTSDPSADPTQPVMNVSGGVDLEAQHVAIDGDVVGRDKVTQAGDDIVLGDQVEADTYIEHATIVQGKANQTTLFVVAGIVGVFAVVLVVLMVVLYQSREPELIEVPNVENQSADDVKSILERKGLIVETRKEYHATIEAGYATRTQPPQGANVPIRSSIQLWCGAPTNIASATISSGVGGWGSWTDWIQCENGFINRATLMIEPSRSGGDDTGAVDADFYCSSGTRLWHSGPHYSWGDWKTLQSCPDGTAICGLQTKVERDQGGGDDTALNDVRFYCCSLP